MVLTTQHVLYGAAFAGACTIQISVKSKCCTVIVPTKNPYLNSITFSIKLLFGKNNPNNPFMPVGG
jgi:hypothetical protein